MPELKGFDEIVRLWISTGKTGEAAKKITIEQVEAFICIIYDDNKWQELVEVFRRGRLHDAWLAVDWPEGFDELILCAPLCKLVEWECARCYVGKRQDNFSCANDDSLFGYIAVLMAIENRDLLLHHMNKIKLVLDNDNIFWDMKKHDINIRTSITGE